VRHMLAGGSHWPFIFPLIPQKETEWMIA